jgi:hypothetical protein
LSNGDRSRHGGGEANRGDDAPEHEEPAHPFQALHKNPLIARAMYLRYVQRKAARREAARQVEIPESGGAALPRDLRGRMEAQLGADLSGVRVHTGSESALAAEQLGARAFTSGAEVHFGLGQYAPGTKEGDRLLAHELTHTVQAQRSGVQRKAKPEAGDQAGADGDDQGVEVSQPNDPAEQEADRVADHAAEGLHGDGERPDGTLGETGKQPAPAIGAKLDRIALAPAGGGGGFFGRLFGRGQKNQQQPQQQPTGQGTKPPGPIAGAEQIDPLVKNVRELLDRPIPPETKQDLEAKWNQLDRANADLKKALAGTDPAILAQAEAEVDAIRMSASGTVQGSHGAVGGGGAPALAKANWQRASAMVRTWATSGVTINLDGIQRINQVLGEGLENNGGVPGQLRTGWVGAGVKGGAPDAINPYLPPKNVPGEIAAFIAWYQKNKNKLKPVELAARAYQQLVSIHPFMDANGRTCRLAMDWVLQSHGLPPAAVQGEEVNVALFGLDPVAGRQSVDPDHALRAVTAGIERTIATMKRVIAQAKQRRT